MAKKTVKTRDSGCCSVNFLKYVLQIYNVLLLLVGMSILCVGLWTAIYKLTYTSLLPSFSYLIATYLLVGAGSLTVLVSIIGCCSVWREHKFLLLIFSFFLMIIFAMEALSGVLSYVYATNVESELNVTLGDTFVETYGIDTSKTRAIDAMHQEYKCCGANNYDDWTMSEWRKSNQTKNLVPDSCCKTMTPHCGLRDHPSNIPYTGCMDKFIVKTKYQLNILGAVGLGVCLMPLFGVIISCTLYVKLRGLKDYD